MVVKSKSGKEYEYDYNRTKYMRKYYADRREALNKKAIKKYRDKVTAKFQ